MTSPIAMYVNYVESERQDAINRRGSSQMEMAPRVEHLQQQTNGRTDEPNEIDNGDDGDRSKLQGTARCLAEDLAEFPTSNFGFTRSPKDYIRALHERKDYQPKTFNFTNPSVELIASRRKIKDKRSISSFSYVRSKLLTEKRISHQHLTQIQKPIQTSVGSTEENVDNTPIGRRRQQCTDRRGKYCWFAYRDKQAQQEFYHLSVVSD